MGSEKVPTTNLYFQEFQDKFQTSSNTKTRNREVREKFPNSSKPIPPKSKVPEKFQNSSKVPKQFQNNSKQVPKKFQCGNRVRKKFQPLSQVPNRREAKVRKKFQTETRVRVEVRGPGGSAPWRAGAARDLKSGPWDGLAETPSNAIDIPCGSRVLCGANGTSAANNPGSDAQGLPGNVPPPTWEKPEVSARTAVNRRRRRRRAGRWPTRRTTPPASSARRCAGGPQSATHNL